MINEDIIYLANNVTAEQALAAHYNGCLCYFLHKLSRLHLYGIPVSELTMAEIWFILKAFLQQFEMCVLHSIHATVQCWCIITVINCSTKPTILKGTGPIQIWHEAFLIFWSQVVSVNGCVQRWNQTSLPQCKSSTFLTLCIVTLQFKHNDLMSLLQVCPSKYLNNVCQITLYCWARWQSG